MSLREIVLWPDPRLSQVCAPVGDVTDDIRTQAEDMLETMYAATGRGLAAPQIGVLNRIFVMDTGWKEGRSDPLAFINPEVLEVSETLADHAEGCLSIPGVTASIARPDRVHMVWTSLEGARVCQVFTGIEAVCVQHELDHLNGIVTLDHLAPDARDALETDYAT